MSRIQISGRPKLSYTPSGKAVLEINQNIAPRRKTRDSGTWDQKGSDLWIRGSLWDDDAERVASHCPDGWRVVLEGDLAAREYTDRDGHPRLALELLYPRLVGLVPPRDSVTPTSPQAPAAQDPWGTPGTDYGQEPPF